MAQFPSSKSWLRFWSHLLLATDGFFKRLYGPHTKRTKKRCWRYVSLFFRHEYEIFKIAHNLYEPSQLTTTNGSRSNNLVTVIWSLSEGLDKMALGIVKIRLGSPFSANRRCAQSVCCGQLSWTLICSHKISVFMCESSVYFGPPTFG